MHALERPIVISDKALKLGEESHATAYFEFSDSSGKTNYANLPIWFNRVSWIQNGMGWFTHRRVFRQLNDFGMTPLRLVVKTPKGNRIYTKDTHRSVIEGEDFPDTLSIC